MKTPFQDSGNEFEEFYKVDKEYHLEEPQGFPCPDQSIARGSGVRITGDVVRRYDEACRIAAERIREEDGTPMSAGLSFHIIDGIIQGIMDELRERRTQGEC